MTFETMRKSASMIAVALLAAAVSVTYLPGSVTQAASVARKLSFKKPVIIEQYLVSGYYFDGSTATVRIDPATNSITMVFSNGASVYSYKGHIDTYSYQNGDYEVTGEVHSEQLDDDAYVAFVRNSATGEYSGIFSSYSAPMPSWLIPI